MLSFFDELRLLEIRWQGNGLLTSKPELNFSAFEEDRQHSVSKFSFPPLTEGRWLEERKLGRGLQM